MATLTIQWTGKALANILGGETAGESITVDYLSDTIKLALLNALPDIDTVEFFGDVDENEVTGTGWSAGGATLASKTVNYTAGTNTVGLDAADISASNTTLSGVTHAIIYKDTGDPATSPVLGIGTLDETVNTSDGTLAITFDSAGLLTGTAS